MRVLISTLGGMLLVACTAVTLAASPARTTAGKSQETPAYVVHKVTRGETLWRISQKHQTSVGAIMDYNRMTDQTVREGMTLRIPIKKPEVQKQPRQHLHIVADGETFWSIADRYSISPEALATANPNINPNRIHEDMELVIPGGQGGSAPPAPRPESPPAAPDTSMLEHVVQPNETYYSIAKRYGVPMETVVAANPQTRPERLREGMKIWVPQKGAKPASPPAPGGSTSARTYKIREGDSMATIAQKFGVTEASLLKQNNLSQGDPFYVDDVLKIPATSSASGPKPKSPSQAVEKPGSISPPAPKPKANPPNNVNGDGAVRSYIVSATENAESICEAFGITKQQLFEYNRMPMSTKLKPGDEIMIPRPGMKRR